MRGVVGDGLCGSWGRRWCWERERSRLFDNPQPSDKLVESRLIKVANPVLPILEHPKLIGVGADLIVVARLQVEDVRRRVPGSATGYEESEEEVMGGGERRR